MEKVSYFLKLGEKCIDILKKEKLIKNNLIKFINIIIYFYNINFFIKK
jgi:hypothetical protein